MPGLTAEASLYRTNKHYQRVEESMQQSDKQSIIPQAPDCFWSGTCYYCCTFVSGQDVCEPVMCMV
jgi:hypothetical protein